MTNFEILTLSISGTAVIVSIIAILLSGTLNLKMFKRQGIIDLFMAWQGISDIDPQNLIGPDVTKAANALNLTATLWNHDVIEKNILYQSYWEPYRDLYDTLYSIRKTPPGLKKNCKDMISSDMTKAYDDMKEFQMKSVKQTKIWRKLWG